MIYPKPYSIHLRGTIGFRVSMSYYILKYWQGSRFGFKKPFKVWLRCLLQ